jgi:hypothetical protein
MKIPDFIPKKQNQWIKEHFLSFLFCKDPIGSLVVSFSAPSPSLSQIYD